MQTEAAASGIPVVARLGSVTNEARVAGVIADEKVEIILHAGAYKHVPLVEENELEGARNNVLGTRVVAEAAAAAKIERFILIFNRQSGAPNQYYGGDQTGWPSLLYKICKRAALSLSFRWCALAMCLDHPVSVLPLFQRQIAMGGPLTVTHPDVTRFFMTIPEAARLVLLAGAYATDGDVFVLDMGKPQKIVDIARQMITLSGRSVKDPETGEGDIAIEITGLRPGEKAV